MSTEGMTKWRIAAVCLLTRNGELPAILKKVPDTFSSPALKIWGSFLAEARWAGNGRAIGIGGTPFTRRTGRGLIRPRVGAGVTSGLLAWPGKCLGRRNPAVNDGAIIGRGSATRG
jgi:hypothetical protein